MTTVLPPNVLAARTAHRTYKARQKKHETKAKTNFKLAQEQHQQLIRRCHSCPALNLWPEVRESEFALKISKAKMESTIIYSREKLRELWGEYERLRLELAK